MKDLFYKPQIGPERDYLSEKEFEPYDLEELPEVDEPDVTDPFAEIRDNIKKIILNSEIIPEEIRDNLLDTLVKIGDDIKDEVYLPEPPETVTPDVPKPPTQTPGIDQTDDEESGRKPVSKDNNVVVKDKNNKEISIFPEDNGIEVELEKKEDLAVFVRDSFLKDKQDMYGNFINKLKLMIQQYMREILYIAKSGEFKDYKDLYIRYDTASKDLPKGLMHVGDSIIKSQIIRDQKTRMLAKTFSIDHTIAHLIANKVTYEQRQRYYNTPYIDGVDYLAIKENDEIRKMRDDYDKKYEHSMYNYYKYLNSSVILADEALQYFVSEARNKSILKKHGVDPAAGYKKEEALKEKRQEEYRKSNEDAQKAEMEKKKSKIDMLKKAGKA